jgi:amino acid transporter
MSQAEAEPDQSSLTRGFSFWSSFSLGFAVVSPIIAVYSVLGYAVQRGGPGAWWTFLIVMVGALAIGAVFGQLASRFPYEGSVYQWCRRLGGAHFGWWSGWTYLYTYFMVTAALTYGVVTFLPQALNMQPLAGATKFLVALAVLVLATLANTTTRRWLKVLVVASIIAEVIGSVGVGTILLFFHRQQSPEVFINYNGHGVFGGLGVGGMLGALALVGWAYNGFDSAAAIGEEVRDPERAIPRAILLVIFIIALVAMYSSAAIILALPDIGAVISGTDGDPVVSTIVLALGETWARPLFGLFAISFFAGLVSVQTTLSRTVWAFARDGVLPFSKSLVPLAGPERLPVKATVAVAVIGAVVLLIGLQENVFATLVTFTTGGFFIVFLLALGCFLYRKLKGQWQDGPWTLGRFAVPVTIFGLIWSALEFVNIAWPRPDLPWYEAWGVIIMMGLVALIGIAVYLPLRDRISTSWSVVDEDEKAISHRPSGSAQQPQVDNV